MLNNINIDKLMEIYRANRGGFNGAGIGFAIALLFLTVGLIRTLFIALCVGVGYYIGKKISEDKDYLKNLLDSILPPGTYR